MPKNKMYDDLKDFSVQLEKGQMERLKNLYIKDKRYVSFALWFRKEIVDTYLTMIDDYDG